MGLFAVSSYNDRINGDVVAIATRNTDSLTNILKEMTFKLREWDETKDRMREMKAEMRAIDKKMQANK